MRFKQGLDEFKNGTHAVYNHKVKGSGLTAEYICCSDVTKRVLAQWQDFEHVKTQTKTWIQGKLSILRETWKLFLKDPQEHIDTLMEVHTTTMNERLLQYR